MNKNIATPVTPLEKYEEAALEYALYQIALDEAKIIAEDHSKDHIIEEHCQTSFSKMISVIDRELKYRNRRAFLSTILPNIIKVAAVFVSALSIACTVAVATSNTVRTHVINFLIHATPQYHTVGYFRSDQTINVPSEWTFDYYITFIPDGFELLSCNVTDSLSQVIYQNSDGDYVSYLVGSVYSRVNVDSEDSDISSMTVNGSEVTYIDKHRNRTIIGQIGNCYYVISSTLPKEELVQVAQSLSLIEH